MPLATIPVADAPACTSWTEQDGNLYNRLDFYLAKMQVERRKHWLTWQKFFGKIKWQQNQGDTMRSVAKEPSPHIRQFAFPNPITQAPKKDVMDIRERSVDEVIYRHRFESPILHFLPSFRDFLTHVDDNGKDIMEKMERFEDIFLRGRVFHQSPNVWVPNAAGGSLVPAPVGKGNSAGTDGKTTAFLQAVVPTIGNPGNLSLVSLNTALTALEVDLGVPAFKGSGLPKEDRGMSDMYVLLTSSEAYNQFIFDPWLLTNKNCSFDVINDRFKGSIFGRITAILEDKPLRFQADGTFPAPEVRNLNPNDADEGETIPNPVYTSPEQTPYEIAFLIGGQGYDSIEVGPPPGPFASNGMPKGFGKMQWNGEVMITKNILVPCYDEGGNLIQEPNVYGEYLKFISQATYGIRAKQKRNILPIIFKRKRGE